MAAGVVQDVTILDWAIGTGDIFSPESFETSAPDTTAVELGSGADILSTPKTVTEGGVFVPQTALEAVPEPLFPSLKSAPEPPSAASPVLESAAQSQLPVTGNGSGTAPGTPLVTNDEAAAAAEPTSGLAAEDIFRHLLAHSLLPSDGAPAVEYPSHAAVEYPSHAASVDPAAASVVPPGASESVAPTQASGPTAVQTAVKDVTPQPVAVEVRESVAEPATPGKRDSAHKNIFAAFWDFFKP